MMYFTIQIFLDEISTVEALDSTKDSLIPLTPSVKYVSKLIKIIM